MKISPIVKMWISQTIHASFWAFVIAIVTARTYLTTPEAFKTTWAVLKLSIPLIGLMGVPIVVLRALSDKIKRLENRDPGPNWKYIGPDLRKVEYLPAPPVKGQRLRLVDDKPIVHHGPECAECFETKGSRECLGH